MKNMSISRVISITLTSCLSLLPWVSQALDIGVSHIVYSTPDQQKYLEVTLEIAPESIQWSKVDSNTMQAKAEVLMLIKQGENIIGVEKYNLNSPVVLQPKILLDLKRFALSNGEYLLEVSVQDLNSPTNVDTYRAPISVQISQQVYLSDLQLLRSFKSDDGEGPFTKNGFYLEPLPFSFYDKYASTLVFYAEMYHTSTKVTAPTYQVRYMVERVLGNVSDFIAAGHQKKKPSDIDAALVQLDISKLESGNYNLIVELRGDKNELLATRKLSFQRSNPFLKIETVEMTPELVGQEFVRELKKETLIYTLKALSPVVSKGSETDEIKNILQSDNEESMRFFVFRYFASVDPNQPGIAWRKFYETAAAADKLFYSGFRHGFETDRGRTYMKYGLPDDKIRVEDDPNAPPYEIWVYFAFPKTQQSNVKFLFYNPSLAGEDFRLLHSNARGELSNPRWEIELYKRGGANPQIEGDDPLEGSRMQRNVNRNARVYLEDF
jgi:GWxTD domain-containing protein